MKCKNYLKIIGNQPLSGVIKVSGSKNAALPIIAASLLYKGKTKLINVPKIKDVTKMLEILKKLNVETKFKENTLYIDTTNMVIKDLLMEEVSEIRGAYYLIPTLLEENRNLKFREVGGCQFASRPIDYHIDLLKRSGVKVTYKTNYNFVLDEFKDFEFEFNKKSVGATMNALILGSRSGKKVLIKNYAKEPEVICLIDFLKELGIEIEYNDESISLMRKSPLKSVTFSIIPDRIEAETFALLGLSLGKIGIFDFIKEHHTSFLNFLNLNYIPYECEDNYLFLTREKPSLSNDLLFDSYPSLSTDIGPIMLSYLLLGDKMFILEDNIYPNRLSKLVFFHKCFTFNKKQLLVNPHNLEQKNRVFYGSNLRDTMAYLFYCLTHDGEFELYGLEHLERGYEDIVDKLISLNAKVEEVE